MQTDTTGPLVAASVRLIIGAKWPNFDLEPSNWRREDVSGRVLGRQHQVELLEVASPNGVPCVIHACAFASPGEIEYLRRAVHFYKASTSAAKADPILVTLAIDPEDAYTALAAGLEIDKTITSVIAPGPIPRLNGTMWESVSVEEICKPSGSRIILPVPPPKIDAKPTVSRYDSAPLPTPLPGTPTKWDTDNSSRQFPTELPPRTPDSKDDSSPLTSSGSATSVGTGSRRGEMLSRSVSHSPAIGVNKTRAESLSRTPDSLRREAVNKSPLRKVNSRDDPAASSMSASSTSPSRVSQLGAYDSDGRGSGEGVDSEEEGSRLDVDKVPQSDKRKHVVLEIVNTERDYVKDLELLLDGFHRPISKLALLPPPDISAVFSNVAELLSINKEFLLHLESKKDAAGADPSSACLGAAFARSVEGFKRYGRYFTDYVFAYGTVQKAIDQNGNFAAFLEENQANPRLRGLKLDQFLIKPVQRICKYPLLLRELLKATPADHPDFVDLQSATADIEALVAQLNEKKRSTETQQKVLELMNMVDGLDKNPNFPRNTLRAFVMEGELKVLKKTGKYRVVLFNDAVFWLLAKDKPGKDGRKIEFTGLAAINATARMVDIADTEEGTVAFVCVTPAEKRKWVREVRQLVNEQLKKDMKQKALTESGGRGTTPLRLTGSLRASSIDIASGVGQPPRRESNPDGYRASTARDHPSRKFDEGAPLERKGSSTVPTPATPPAAAGLGAYAGAAPGSPGSARVPLGQRLRERGTD